MPTCKEAERHNFQDERDEAGAEIWMPNWTLRAV